MSKTSQLPIGVFDSGVGGLTVLREIRRLLPGESTLYLGDTARVPYGTKSAATVQRYGLEDAGVLVSRGVKLLVVACNTVSAVAIPALAEKFKLPLTGVIEPGAAAAAAATKSGKIGVIGTSATVRSKAYWRALQAVNPALEVESRACPLFVSLAEEGWTEGPVAELAAKRYLEPFAGTGIDVLLLGCTHYPLLREVIAQAVGEGVNVIDSAGATAARVKDLLIEKNLAAPAGVPVRHEYLVTDSRDRFLELAPRFLGGPLGGEVEEVRMPD